MVRLIVCLGLGLSLAIGGCVGLIKPEPVRQIFIATYNVQWEKLPEAFQRIFYFRSDALIGLPSPNVDLHIYTFGGRHVGFNYSNCDIPGGVCAVDLQIPGTIDHLSLGLGPDQLDIPAGVEVYPVVDPTPMRFWLDAYNRLAANRTGFPRLNASDLRVAVNLSVTTIDSAGVDHESQAATFEVGIEKPELAGARANVDFDPDVLNAKSRGQFVTAYIELPGFDPGQVSIPTVRLVRFGPNLASASTLAFAVNGTNYGFARNLPVGDHDGDGVPDAMVKFPRGPVLQGLAGESGNVTLNVAGRFKDGTPFSGSGQIRLVG